jgi:glycosyltransferase involved in cell wall biosynthesis
VKRCVDFGVDFYSFADLVTGLGTSSRGFASALSSANVPTHFQSVRFICPDAVMVDHGFVSDARRFLVTFEHANADMTMALERRLGPELATAGYRIAMWYWELAAFRPDWIHCAEHYDEIWVGSTFGRRAVQAVTKVPVHVVPPPVTANDGDGARARRDWGIPDTAFVFLYVFDYSSYVDRKNPLCLIDAYLSEFGDDSRYRLVLKVSYGRAGEESLRAIAETCSRHDTVCIVDAILPDDDLDDLYAMADCYVSPHRSEGFGLTVAEQMLRGCPVIATDYGATTDFVNPEVAYPLAFRLMEIESDQGPYPAGYVWANPLQDRLAELMRQVVDDADGATRKAAAAKRAIGTSYNVGTRGQDVRARLERAHAIAVARKGGV